MRFWNASLKMLGVTVLLGTSSLSANPTTNEGDALYEVAYETSLPSPQTKRNKNLLASLLNDRLKAQDPYAFALNQFGQNRSVETAEKILESAQTQRQKALAFLCLAEAYFAKQDNAKTILYSMLSLGTHPSEAHDRQVQFYFKKIMGEPVSLLSSKEALLEKFRDIMHKNWSPKAFRGAFEAATVISLLPQYPIPQPSGEPTDPLQIFLSFDNGYTQHAGVTILSAVLSAEANTRYTFNIMEDKHNPISNTNKERLQALSRIFGNQRFDVKLITMGREDLPAVLQKFNEKDWPLLVFFKLMIPQLAKDSSRALWLDSDIIVRADLTPYYMQDFKDSWFVGTRDVYGGRYLNRMGHKYDEPYINVGVVLFNNDAINTGNGLGMLEHIIHSYPDYMSILKLPEQDLMATLYQHRVREVGQQIHMTNEDTYSNSEWNWLAMHHPSTQWPVVHTHFSKIVHMEGNKIKPWKQRWNMNKFAWKYSPQQSNGIQSMYWTLREMSPWSQL